MTQNANALPPANWYPDPRDQAMERYWDGQSWTAETRPVGGAAAPAEPAAAVGEPGGQEPGAQQAAGQQAAAQAGAAQEPAGRQGATPFGQGVGLPEQQGAAQAGRTPFADIASGSATGTQQNSEPAREAGMAAGAAGGGFAFGGGGAGAGTAAPMGSAAQPAEQQSGGLAAGRGLGAAFGGGEPARSVEPPAAAGAGGAPEASQIPVSTGDDVPGRATVRFVSDACGVAVRAAGTSSDKRAMIAARREAVEQLRQDAVAAGGNAVVGMRFDSSSGPDGGAEVVAYGTAVVVERA
jgi:uncharacterized protein YbjQ (UPF0145 family)